MTEASQPLIGPQVRYPTPWDWAIAADAPAALTLRAADGTCGAVVYEEDVAELIVRLVNREADPGMVNLLEANDALQECSGQLAEARAEIERLTRMVEWQAWARGAAGHNSYNAGLCECGDTFTDLVTWQWHRFDQS